MAPHQAQRTLVKSRPELWAEVSDVTSLCKHLNDFGDITITRLEPETTVAWEGTAARGTVELETSGWGTKVTLTAELLDADADADGPQPDAVPEPEPVAVVPPRPAREPEPEGVAAVVPEPVPEPAAVVVAEPDPAPGPEPPAAPAKPGYFARLFRRKPSAPGPTPAERAAARDAVRATPIVPPKPPVAETPVAETPVPSPTPLPAVADPEPAAVPEPEPAAVPEPDEPVEPDGPPPLVALDDAQALAVLTSALDDLGAAHRRPFSHS